MPAQIISILLCILKEITKVHVMIKRLLDTADTLYFLCELRQLYAIRRKLKIFEGGKTQKLGQRLVV